MSYFLIVPSEDWPTIIMMKDKDRVIEHIKELNESWFGTARTIISTDTNERGMNYIIIKWEIITPKEVRVVKDFEIE